ncbi:glycosyltransferase [Salinisphaera sp. G21_0]|uniref:glycosyltransferase family 4 protein n=1 Tax=Salinisphaera sp. G21_0 TaxID=2821094 RepID=UPI001ADA00C3|nr:glycosyltransferase family 4 protein [Salinisphaera sp. G21_0]
MKILFIVNAPEFFLSHRLPLALAAREAGYCVQIATGPGPACEQIRELGFVHHQLPLSRSGTNPWLELSCLWALWHLIRRIEPNLLHLVTIKPVLYGGLMARLAGVPAVLVAISGLGSVFVARGGVVAGLRRGVQMLYRFALQHPNLKAIFQNPDDKALLTGFGVVREDQAVLIRGSGVDLADYPVKPEPAGIPVVTLAARLLKEKGVLEFVEAARLLKDRGVASHFCLVGTPDPGNPSSVSDKEIEHWRASGLIEPLGYRTDIADVFANANLVVLPSYYGEGLPKVLIEAAATGRAVITTDQPGCRDAIEPNVTGLLVPPRDALALADAIEDLLANSELRQSMGNAGRKLAERDYGIEKVVKAHLQIYQELLDLASLGDD